MWMTLAGPLRQGQAIGRWMALARPLGQARGIGQMMFWPIEPYKDLPDTFRVFQKSPVAGRNAPGKYIAPEKRRQPGLPGDEQGGASMVNFGAMGP